MPYAARKIRSDPQRLLDDTPHLPNWKVVMRETTPGMAKHGGGSPSRTVNASPLASNAAREIRSDPQRLLVDTPHLPNRKLTRCHHPPRIKTF